MPLRLPSLRAVVFAATSTLLLAPPSLPAQTEVSFPSSDGGVVSADVYGTGSQAVVLAPGGRFTKASWAPQARALAAAGLRVLAIDFRGRGRSRAGPHSAPDGDRFDVLGAIRYLHRTGAVAVSVVGASLGGEAAALAVVASAPGEVRRLVLLAAVPIATPERIGVPTLFIVSRGDTTGSGTPRLVAIRRQYDRVQAPKQLLVVDGSSHAQFLFETDQSDRVLRAIQQFLMSNRSR